jgi:hypothetical protein
MPLYDAENRLRTDGCATKTVDEENRRRADYNVNNLRGFECTDKDHVQAFAGQHKNLRPWDGYGMDASKIDGDSSIRYDAGRVTHAKCKQQLQNRLFQAVPDLHRGKILPSLESRILSGSDTSHIRACDPLGEKPYDVFHPHLCPDVVNPEGARIGLANSRDIARSPAFLQSMGYAYDGRAWRRV